MQREYNNGDEQSQISEDNRQAGIDWLSNAKLINEGSSSFLRFKRNGAAGLVAQFDVGPPTITESMAATPRR